MKTNHVIPILRGGYESPTVKVIDLQLEDSVCLFDSSNLTEGFGRDDMDEL